jgi:hypothetical protein
MLRNSVRDMSDAWLREAPVRETQARASWSFSETKVFTVVTASADDSWTLRRSNDSCRDQLTDLTCNARVAHC